MLDLPMGSSRPEPVEGGSASRVAAVVVGTNERVWLDACLSSLLGSRSVDLAVVYVDNDSADGSAQHVRECYAGVEVLTAGRNLGFAGGNNIGLERAGALGATYALIVNPDTRTPRHLIAELTRFMDRHSQYGLVGPMQRQYAEIDDAEATTPLNEWSSSALARGEVNVFWDDAPHHPSPAGNAAGRAPDTLEHAYVQGAAMFIRMAALARTGRFDPVYHTFYEEVDLARRMRWCGYRVALVLNLSIQHHGGGSTTASKYRSYHLLRNRYYFLLSDPTWGGRQSLILIIRWFVQSLRLALFGRDDDWIRPTPGMVMRVTAWLLRNAGFIRSRRRAHRRLISDGVRDVRTPSSG
jgi:hypothetical protein